MIAASSDMPARLAIGLRLARGLFVQCIGDDDIRAARNDEDGYACLLINRDGAAVASVPSSGPILQVRAPVGRA